MLYKRGVHLHLIYVYMCEDPLFNWGGGIYLPSLNIPPCKQPNFYWMVFSNTLSLNLNFRVA